MSACGVEEDGEEEGGKEEEEEEEEELKTPSSGCRKREAPC